MSTPLAFFSGISAQALSSSLRHLKGVPAKITSGTMCGEVRTTNLPCPNSWVESRLRPDRAAEASPQTFDSRQHCTELSHQGFFFFKISNSSTGLQFIIIVTFWFWSRLLQLEPTLTVFFSILSPGWVISLRAPMPVGCPGVPLTDSWSYFPVPFSRGPPRTSSCVWWGVLAADGSLLGWRPLSETSLGHCPAHASGHYGQAMQVKFWAAKQRTRWFYLKAKTFLFHSLFLSFPSPFGHGKNLTVVHYRELPGELMLAGQFEASPGRGGSWIVLSDGWAYSAVHWCPELFLQQKIVLDMGKRLKEATFWKGGKCYHCLFTVCF